MSDPPPLALPAAADSRSAEARSAKAEATCGKVSAESTVMRGLVPRIHVFRAAAKAWMAGTSPDKPGHDDV